jgi:alanine racemase
VNRNLRGTYALVDLKRYLNNLNIARKLSKSYITPVIKANGYGHGAIELARFTLEHSDIRIFCVATFEEGVTLRDGIGEAAEIIVLGFVDEYFFNELITNNLLINIYDDEIAFRFNKYLEKKGMKYPVSIKIDTGMNRLGFDVSMNFSDFNEKYPNLIPKVLMSHLSSPDSDLEYTSWQIDRFSSVVERAKKIFPHIKSSLFNSSALLSFENSFDYSRPGILTYGFVKSDYDIGIKPVMKIFSKIIHVKYLDKNESVGYNRTYITGKKTILGVLPIGYADGYNRLLSNKGFVYVDGYKCPIIGRICMDMTMIDISDLPEGKWYKEVEILGDNIRADEMAKMCNTISYEILTSISSRIPRIYEGIDE